MLWIIVKKKVLRKGNTERKTTSMVKNREIKAYMTRKGMTQLELAKAIGINVATFNRKINDETGEKITLREAQKIADVLGMSDSERTKIFFS